MNLSIIVLPAFLALISLPVLHGQDAPASEVSSEVAPPDGPPSEASTADQAVRDILERDQKEITRLTERMTKAVETRQQELLKALEIQMRAAQNAGDLDSLLELRTEIAQVKRGILLGEPKNQPTDDDGRRTFALLKRARDAYNEASTNARIDFEKELSQLNQKTGDELHKVMRDLTRAGEIDAAIAARAEMNRVRGRKQAELAGIANAREGLPTSEHTFTPEQLTQRLLKTSWRRTQIATGAEETVSFERGVTHRGQRWDVLPDGTVMLNAGRNAEIWTFNATLTEAKGYVRGADRISFTALRQ